MNRADAFVTAPEAAQRAGCSLRTVWHAVAAGALRATRFSPTRCTRFHVDDIGAWVRSRGA